MSDLNLAPQNSKNLNKKPSQEPLMSTTSTDSSASPISPASSTSSAQQPLAPLLMPSNNDDGRDNFMAVLNSVKYAISVGIYPTRIEQGSSGSYFCRNSENQIVAVFKPKNEEPYGHLNPKWTKWLHKTCCPCFFGRSCLIPNLGYVSEAAASCVDRHLGFNVVPHTEIVSLASPTFYYSYIDRRNAQKPGGTLPPKIGSFQLFMNGYMDATKFLREGPLMLSDGRLPKDSVTGGLRGDLQSMFQDQFEKLVILDFIIRNTDRGLDNWMVKAVAEVERPLLLVSDQQTQTATSAAGSGAVSPAAGPPSARQAPTNSGIIRIAAIDNGLAFPFKHPDQWRSYPYGWSYLPASRVKFSKQATENLFPLLDSKEFWDKLIADLLSIFRTDPDFDRKLFRRQMALMKGQAYNVLQVLCGMKTSRSPLSPRDPRLSPSRLESGDYESGTPFDLITMPNCLIWEDDDVRDLSSGGLFGEIRDGMLGTIIGGIEALRPRNPVSLDTTNLIETQPSGASSVVRGKSIVDIGQGVGSVNAHAVITNAQKPNEIKRGIEDIIEEKQEDLPVDIGSFLVSGKESQSGMPSSSTFGGSAEHARKRERGFGAFKGRIITFVKSQPWISWW